MSSTAKEATDRFSSDELASLYEFSTQAQGSHSGPSPRIIIRNECAYAHEQLQLACRLSTPAFRLVSPALPANIIIDEFKDIPWDAVFRGDVVAGSYFTRKGLSRKANLAHFLNAHIAKYPGCRLSSGGLPTSIPIDTWEAFQPCTDPMSELFGLSSNDRVKYIMENYVLPEAVAAMRKTGGLWMLKASLANKGEGLFLVDNEEELKDLLIENEDAQQWVLQKYVENPLLVKRHKFHYRLYVLATGSLQVYVYRIGLIMFASKPYSSSDRSKFSHITNAAVAGQRKNYSESRFMFTSDQLLVMMEEDGIKDAKTRMQTLNHKLRKLVADTFHAFKGKVAGFMPMENTFELFGIDFIVDEDFNPWLLEVNPQPDVKTCGEKMSFFVHSVFKDMFSLLESSLHPEVQNPAASTLEETTHDSFGACQHRKYVLRDQRSVTYEQDEATPGNARIVKQLHCEPQSPRPMWVPKGFTPDCNGFLLGSENGWDCVLKESWPAGSGMSFSD